MVKPHKDSIIKFNRDWGCYSWSVSAVTYNPVRGFVGPYLKMIDGGSVWEWEDGYRACWRFLGAM